MTTVFKGSESGDSRTSFEDNSLGIENEYIFTVFAPFVNEPVLVYSLLIGMMLLSSIGLPIPEEVTLLTVGFLAYMGAHPELFPPPYEGAPYVHAPTAAAVAFLAVFGADFLIYGIGRLFGPKLMKWGPIHRVISDETMAKVQDWTRRYGAYACGIFRFTPGIRFPGHLACGMLRFPAWKFALVDGIAALISVPTQIFLIAHYGDEILGTLKKFKIILFSLIGLVLIYFIVRKIRNIWLKRKSSRVSES